MTILHDRFLRMPLALVLASLLVMPTALASPEHEANAGPPDIGLYVSGDSAWRTYLPLDPATLSDTTAPALDFGEEYPDWELSADGSTFVLVEHPPDSAIVHVYDGLGGPERLSFRAGVPAFNPQLSADGARIVLHGDGYHLFETKTGRHLSTTEMIGRSDGLFDVGSTLIHWAGNRLYHVFVAENGPAEGPWPLQLAAYDLTSGEQVGRLSLPDILAGSWSGARVEQVPVFEVQTPGIALSPDGSRLAIVGADRQTVTLVDSKSLTVHGAHALYHPTGLLDRVIGWFAPQSAEAKHMDGAVVSATFAADGRHVYVYGYEGSVGETREEAAERGLGLMVVDAETGEVVAEALAGEFIWEVLLAPDGETIYTIGPSESRLAAPRVPDFVARRLDVTSLEVLAEREFDGQRRLFMVPAPAVASLPDPGCTRAPVADAPNPGSRWGQRKTFPESGAIPCLIRVAGS